jgi:hypothetical protein
MQAWKSWDDIDLYSDQVVEDELDNLESSVRVSCSTDNNLKQYDLFSCNYDILGGTIRERMARHMTMTAKLNHRYKTEFLHQNKIIKHRQSQIGV